jgi:hypothetical protein
MTLLALIFKPFAEQLVISWPSVADTVRASPHFGCILTLIDVWFHIESMLVVTLAFIAQLTATVVGAVQVCVMLQVLAGAVEQLYAGEPTNEPPHPVTSKTSVLDADIALSPVIVAVMFSTIDDPNELLLFAAGLFHTI